MSNQVESGAHGPLDIAVVGLSCRFPGAGDVGKFWDNLIEAAGSSSRLPGAESPGSGKDFAVTRLPDRSGAGAAMEDADRFDAEFFGYASLDARITDPQFRLYLETAWHALEGAGYDASKRRERVGVFVSSSRNGYLRESLSAHPELLGQLELKALLNANDQESFAARIACKLVPDGLSGCSRTASSALAAVHLACRSLLLDECDLALAGGVSLGVPHFREDGSAENMDFRTAVTFFQDGMGAVVLKRLSEATRDQDCILAVIKASSVRDCIDGPISAASGAEERMQAIQTALAVSGVHPETIGLVESYGMSNKPGDSSELTALSGAFRSLSGKNGYCALSSLHPKSDHADGAWDVACLIKAILSLGKKVIPPALGWSDPGAAIDLSQTPFFLNSRPLPWRDGTLPRRAAVSSFGPGGADVHIILEEPPVSRPPGPGRPIEILTFSATSQAALAELEAKLRMGSGGLKAEDFPAVAQTLNLGRRDFTCRRAYLAESMQAFLSGDSVKSKRFEAEAAEDAEVIFVFPGGRYRNGAGTGLYRDEPRFRAIIDSCCSAFQAAEGWDLRSAMFPSLFRDGEEKRIASLDTEAATAFILEYSLAKLWMCTGIRPAALIGRGPGDLAAACVAGAIGLEAAFRIASGLDMPSEDCAELGPPGIPWVSGAAGTWRKEPDLCVDRFHGASSSEEVQFEARLSMLAARPARILLESQPGPVLGASALSTCGAGNDEYGGFLETIGRIWVSGVHIDWDAFYGEAGGRRISLPGYPFQRKSYWLPEKTSLSQGAGGRVNMQPGAGTAVTGASDEELPGFNTEVPRRFWYG